MGNRGKTVSKTRSMALFSAAAGLTLALAATAGAQQNGPAPGGAPQASAPEAGAAPAGAPAGGARRGGGGGGGGGGGPFGALPAQNEAELKVKHPELFVLAPVSHSYKPKLTSWGDPDLQGMWPTDSFGGLFLERPVNMGDRVWLTPEEYKIVDARMESSREAPEKETKSGHLGMGNWVEMTGAGHRTSLLVDPKNGRLPPLTPEGEKMNKLGRSSWMDARGQSFDWVTDFDSWDRCVSRGFPASMLPFHYNNGLQVMQAPGYVVINLEMIHDARIIPLDGRAKLPAGMTDWMGSSRGHWEGTTLVIETDHIRPGAAPINFATNGAPFGNTIPMSPQAHVTERITPTGPNTIDYQMTYSDPVYWTAPFTVRADWTRNEKYKFFEYACHEGDEQVTNYINTSRLKRAKEKVAAAAPPAPVAEASETKTPS